MIAPHLWIARRKRTRLFWFKLESLVATATAAVPFESTFRACDRLFGRGLESVHVWASSSLRGGNSIRFVRLEARARESSSILPAGDRQGRKKAGETQHKGDFQWPVL